MLHHVEEFHLRGACTAAERGPLHGTPTTFSTRGAPASDADWDAGIAPPRSALRLRTGATRFAVRATCLALSASITLGAFEAVAALAEGPESDTPVVMMPSVEITAPTPATPPTPSAY